MLIKIKSTFNYKEDFSIINNISCLCIALLKATHLLLPVAQTIFFDGKIFKPQKINVFFFVQNSRHFSPLKLPVILLCKKYHDELIDCLVFKANFRSINCMPKYQVCRCIYCPIIQFHYLLKCNYFNEKRKTCIDKNTSKIIILWNLVCPHGWKMQLSLSCCNYCI